MKPDTSITGVASRNDTSAGTLVGRHRQAFMLVEPTMQQTQKNRANDDCGGAVIGRQTEDVTNKPATSGKEVKRMKRLKQHSSSCLVNRRFWSQRVVGFTLIELLATITVITLLLGLIVPGLHMAKKRANHAECISKLKEIYIAIQLYANDNDGRFPNVTDLSQVPLKVMEALKPYVNSDEIFWCPDDPEKSKHPGGSIDYRVTNDPKTTLSRVRLDLLRHPSRVIIAGERSHGWHKTDMMNVLYADGRIDQVTEEEWFRNITTPLDFL